MKPNAQHRPRPRAERGYALIMSLFVMVTLFGMGFVVMNNV